ncbi:MAG: sugar phosphate isomerase/epimerase [Lachnospiraceae bacterium]|nr:sugar phosphate isomerase/epimerase [Lachnospiraceae bacterium]
MYNKITGFADEIAQELDTQIESLQRLGIRYVEMRGVDGNNLIYHSDEKVKEIKKKLDDAGIALSALGTPLGKIGIEDPFEKHFEEFKRAIEVAHMMDAVNLRMFSFYIPEGENAKWKSAVWERMGQFVDYASANDVVLLHENEKGIYGEKAPECLELMKDFAGDHFKAIFDFANFVQAQQDTLEAYEMLKDYIAYIHVKDARLENGVVVPSGYGDGNVQEILKKLFAKGFDGFLSLEPHLFDFKGFENLERGRKATLAQSGQALSGFEAFATAHRALLQILEHINLSEK